MSKYGILLHPLAAGSAKHRSMRGSMGSSMGRFFCFLAFLISIAIGSFLALETISLLHLLQNK